jgi:hypothetical protein
MRLRHFSVVKLSSMPAKHEENWDAWQTGLDWRHGLPVPLQLKVSFVCSMTD